MPQSPIRLPISNHVTGGDYAVTLNVGADALPLSFLLDTGSSLLAVGGAAYDPAADSGATTTKFLQTASYLSTSFVAGVVRTSLALSDGAAAPVALPGVNLAVTYDKRPDNFGGADGIFGLAYEVMDSAYAMPADTWQNRYDQDQVGLGQPCDLDPYYDQLADAGLVNRKFAFSTQRSLLSARQDDPAADPLNAGIFVVGGGAECTDLYQGDFAMLAVVNEKFYNTNLLSVQVGGQPPIPVAPVAPGRFAASNSIIDSGVSSLTLDQDLYDSVIASFGQIQPDFAIALKQCAIGGAAGDQTGIDLDSWPELTLTFQGAVGQGTSTAVVIAPEDYWQFDAAGKGKAVAVMCGDNGRFGGQSVLGLPLFSGHYVVFDRTATNGHGVIGFARQA
jgi:hypothetical protein